MNKKIDYFNPMIFFVIIWFAGVIFPIIPYYFEVDAFSSYWPYHFNDKSAAMLGSFFLYILVLFFVFAGYVVGYRKITPLTFAQYRVVNGVTLFKRGFLYVMISLSSFFLLVYIVGGFDGLFEAASDRTRAFAGLAPLLLLENLILVVSIAWFLRILTTKCRSWERRFYYLFFLTSMGLISINGQKSTIFIILMMMLVIFNSRVKRIGLVYYISSGIFIFIGLVVYHILKSELWATGELHSIDLTSDNISSSFFEYLFFMFSGNMMQFQNMAVLYDSVPASLDWQYGRSVLMVALILIPSALFSDKPLTTPGVYTEAFWPERWLNEGTTMPPGLFGEAYLNFGVFGVVFFACVFGFIWGRLYKNTRTNAFDDKALVAHALALATMLHFFRGELASVMLAVMSIWLPFLFFIKIQKNSL